MTKVTSKQTVENICKIYINERIHLLFFKENVNGIQSWIEHDNKFLIEVIFKEGESLISEYNDKELWLLILNKLDELI